MAGVEQFAIACRSADIVGYTLSTLKLEIADFAKWIVDRGGDLDPNRPLTATISGLVCGLASAGSTELLDAVLKEGKENQWDANHVARFLLLAPIGRLTWDAAASCGTEVERAYWAKVNPICGPNTDQADFDFALDRLLAAGRPRSALSMCCFTIKTMDANRLAEILEQVLTGQEPDTKFPDSWHMMEAIQRLEASEAIERDWLVKTGVRPLSRDPL